MSRIEVRNDWKSLAIMALFATVTLLLVSADSYTHGLFDHFDSATFYTCGKAWFSGMTPYVDFTDSKGPLLWLIYGVGYLLSPADYTGMLWLSCVAYALIFFWLFKTARVYLHDDGRSMVAAMLTALPVFYPWIHYETRAEDFCLFFLVWALYHTCLIVHGSDPTRRQVGVGSAVLGVTMASTFLIKYNVSAMIGVMALFVLHRSWRKGFGILRPLSLMALSSVAVLTPFAIYMHATGSLMPFLNEYFVVNAQVVASQYRIMRHPVFLLWANRYVAGLYLLVCAAGAAAPVLFINRSRWMVLAVFCTVMLLTVTNAHWLYYYALAAPFALFGFVALVQFPGHAGVSARWAVAVVTVAATVGMHLMHDESWFFRHAAEHEAFYSYSATMAQTGKRPSIIYYNTCTSAYGVPVGSLPGCKYWTSQSGALPWMDADQRKAVERHRPDFVFVQKVDDEPEWFASLGYKRFGNDTRLPMVMYSARHLPAKQVHASAADILLKRNLAK